MTLPIVGLSRYFYGPTCTLGLIVHDGGLIYTVEDAWLGNQVGKSCIPDGTYLCQPRQFYRGGYPAIEITGVPGRTTILIHKANTAEDVTGCIGVGTELGVLNGQLAVLKSAAAWQGFQGRYGQSEFNLHIRPVAPLAGTRGFRP